MNKLKYIKKACKINDIIFKEIVDNFYFKTEKEIDKYIKKRFREFKVKQAYPPIVANNNKVIHAKPRNKRLKRGFLILDFGCKYKGYCSDMTRTIFLGKPNYYERKLYNLILNCEKKCIKKLKPGLSYADLDIYARILLKDYKIYFLHGLGHGVSKKIHDLPRIYAISPAKVKKHDIITIEPGIYFKKGGKEIGIRIEDTVYIGNKIRVLTKASKKLVAINI